MIKIKRRRNFIFEALASTGNDIFGDERAAVPLDFIPPKFKKYLFGGIFCNTFIGISLNN